MQSVFWLQFIPIDEVNVLSVEDILQVQITVVIRLRGIFVFFAIF